MSPIVLILDDDPVQCRLSEAAVVRAGWAPRIFTESAAALAFLRRPGADPVIAVLLDLVMPNGGGLAFLRTLRERDCPVPVVMLSSRDDPASVVAAMRAGASDYLVKPVQADRLADAVRAAQRPAPEPAAQAEPAEAAPAVLAPSLPSAPPPLEPVVLFDGKGDIRTFVEIEADIIARAMERYGGRPAAVARAMGIGRSTLYRKLRTLGA